MGKRNAEWACHHSTHLWHLHFTSSSSSVVFNSECLAPLYDRMGAYSESLAPLYDRMGANSEGLAPLYDRMGAYSECFEPRHETGFAFVGPILDRERRLLFPMVQDLSHLCRTRTAIPRNQSGRVASPFRSYDRTRVPSTQNMLPRLESIMMEFIKLSSIGPTKANPVSWYCGSCSAEIFCRFQF